MARRHRAGVSLLSLTHRSVRGLHHAFARRLPPRPHLPHRRHCFLAVVDRRRRQAKSCPGQNSTREDCISCRVCNTTCGGEIVRQTGFGINTQQLGYLQSAFMIGYSLACVVIAQLVHVIPPFKIIGVSLLVWTFAVVLSGLPNILCDKTQEGLCPYFYLMLVGRILSGIGEAAIGTTAVPYVFLDIVLCCVVLGCVVLCCVVLCCVCVVLCCVVLLSLYCTPFPLALGSTNAACQGATPRFFFFFVARHATPCSALTGTRSVALRPN